MKITEAKPSADAAAVDEALRLYAQGELPPGRAAERVGMNKWEFLALAKARNIPMPYTLDMVREDFANAHRH